MDWEFKSDIPDQGTSNGFWYDITDGGYITASEILSNKYQIKSVNDAINLLHNFKDSLMEAEIIEEF